MQEKFHQFNRQDNPKIIQEDLSEADDVIPENAVLSDNLEQEVVAVSENHEDEHVAITDLEKERLFSHLESPKDILSLPTSLRKEGLALIRERIAERYVTVANMQTAIFDKIDELHREGRLDEANVRKEIMARADEFGFGAEDRKVVSETLSFYLRDLERLQRIRHLSERELLQRLIMNKDHIPLITGSYYATVTPYSVHFEFDNREDFRLFVSNTEGEAKTEYKSTYGLSYFNGGVPITASGYKPYAEATFRHEQQHKRFLMVTIDKILKDDKAERATRNEILAFFSELSQVSGLFQDVLSYGFAKTYGMDEALYEKMLRDAVYVIQKLQSANFKKEEIIGLLSKEDLHKWPKVAERIIMTKVGMDLIQMRKKKRAKRRHVNI